MLNLTKIAITGGVASGKTTVCKLLQQLGAYVVDADKVAHELLKPETDLGKKVLQLVGNDVLQHNKIDRRLVAKKVFHSKELLRELESILHPKVMEKIKEEYKRVSKEHKYPLFVAEVPLLFEIGAEHFFDQVITVMADETIASERFISQGHNKTEYMQRMERQLQPAAKAKKSNQTIFNNGSLDDLKKQVASFYTHLLNRGAI